MEVYENGIRVTSQDDICRWILMHLKRFGPARSRDLYDWLPASVSYSSFQRALRTLQAEGLILHDVVAEVRTNNPAWTLASWFWLKRVRLKLRDAQDFCIGLWHALRS